MSNFPWYKSYPAGIPNEVKLYEYNSVTEIFDESCKKYKDKVAFENMGVTMTRQHPPQPLRDLGEQVAPPAIDVCLLSPLLDVRRLRIQSDDVPSFEHR